jgi:hypothetical protein
MRCRSAVLVAASQPATCRLLCATNTGRPFSKAAGQRGFVVRGGVEPPTSRFSVDQASTPCSPAKTHVRAERNGHSYALYSYGHLSLNPQDGPEFCMNRTAIEAARTRRSDDAAYRAWRARMGCGRYASCPRPQRSSATNRPPSKTGSPGNVAGCSPAFGPTAPAATTSATSPSSAGTGRATSQWRRSGISGRALPSSRGRSWKIPRAADLQAVTRLGW